jgi:predicted transposase/invertase (TIGR01784 family)
MKAIREMAIEKNRLDRGQAELIAREEAQEKGRAEGKAEGMVKGRDEKALEIARKMKKAGFPFVEIAEFTGLSLETVQGL